MSTATLSPGVPAVVAEARAPAIELARAPSSLTPVKQAFRSIWFAALLAAICLEGLGRRYLPGIPSAAFYFLKDVVLLVGLIRFRINPEVKKTFRTLYGGYLPLLKLAVLWTVAEIINPDQKSVVLGVLGVRAYWFWWLAPLVISSVLLDPSVRRKAVMLQAAVTMVVAILAMLQFGAPAEADINTYSVVDGEKSLGIEIASTGRARVSSTFSFISGFSDFAVLVPVLLLCLGLGEKDRKARLAALVAMLFAAAALPMSGSRGPFVLTLALCAMVGWRTGLILTKVGRRIIVVAVGAGLLTVFAFPDALKGVMDRFQGDDTEGRMVEFLTVLPPVALAKNEDYAPLGDGTGMMQNYRGQFGVHEDLHTAEGEVGRYLVELGPIGYILFWFAKLGLVMVLWRSAKILKKAGRRAASACALAYALLGFYGSLVFDHIYCALFFVGFGFILQEAVHAQMQLKALARAQHRQKTLPATTNGTAGLLPAPTPASG